jgi:hypothetical protein
VASGEARFARSLGDKTRFALLQGGDACGEARLGGARLREIDEQNGGEAATAIVAVRLNEARRRHVRLEGRRGRTA